MILCVGFTVCDPFYDYNKVLLYPCRRHIRHIACKCLDMGVRISFLSWALSTLSWVSPCVGVLYSSHSLFLIAPLAQSVVNLLPESAILLVLYVMKITISVCLESGCLYYIHIITKTRYFKFFYQSSSHSTIVVWDWWRWVIRGANEHDSHLEDSDQLHQ